MIRCNTKCYKSEPVKAATAAVAGGPTNTWEATKLACSIDGAYEFAKKTVNKCKGDNGMVYNSINDIFAQRLTVKLWPEYAFV